MKNIYLAIFLLSLATACNKQEGTEAARAKKQELETARKDFQALREKITKLEDELKEIDPEYAKETNKAILVSTFVPAKGKFEHRVDVRGSVASRKNVMISAQTPGIIERVHVQEGQRVSKGQVMVSLDADVLKSNIKELKSSLALAGTLYERQSRLWEQKIGTEVQYLQAKNNKEALESRLAASNAQLDQAIVRAPFNGTIDEVPVREGEMASPGLPLVRVTSPDDMYISAEVSERFLGKVVAGDKVDVLFPVQDKNIISTISAVSNVINPENRTFRVEVRLPKTDFVLKPNQVTVLKITDYVNPDAFTVPTRIILRDDQGEYIYAVEKQANAKVAKKVRIKSGATYDGKTEIAEGLQGQEEIVDKGFRDVAEGVQVAVTKSDEISQVAKN